jgi:hypothetical protein
MKTPLLIGILLLVLGVGALAYEGVRYTSRDTVVDAGPIKVTAEREHTLPLSPMLGVAALAAGTVLVIVSMRKRPVF